MSTLITQIKLITRKRVTHTPLPPPPPPLLPLPLPLPPTLVLTASPAEPVRKGLPPW